MRQKKQRILAVNGVKNFGKTTLITKLLTELKKRGLEVRLLSMTVMISRQTFRILTAGNMLRPGLVVPVYFPNRNIW